MKVFRAAIFILCIVASFSANAYTYLNTNSFGIIEGDLGYGQLVGEDATPWSAGFGYQWVVGEQMTLGFEGMYMENGSVNQSGTDVSSRGYVPFVSLYYYLTPTINIFGKAGYGYQQNKYTVDGQTTKNNSWQPVGIGGVGYLIPFSKAVYLNVFADATWANQNNDTAENMVTNAGNALRNMQYKLGLQLMF